MTTRVPWLFAIKGHVEAGHKVLAIVADANRAEFYRDEIVAHVGGAGWQTSATPGLCGARHSSGGMIVFAPHVHLRDRLRGFRFDDWTCEAGLTLTRDENAALASIVLGEPAFDAPVLPPKPGVFTGATDKLLAAADEDLGFTMQLRAMRGEPLLPPAARVVVQRERGLEAPEEREVPDDEKASPSPMTRLAGIAAMVRLPGETDEALRARLKALMR